MEMNQGKFLSLRKDYPLFVYRSFEYRKTRKAFCLSFHFSVCNAKGEEIHSFRPDLTFPMRDFYHTGRIPKDELRKLVFHCGMMELISYWKCVCSPWVRIECGELDEAQIGWFKKLYFNGLGEFFYLNGIETYLDSFMQMECCPVEDGRLLYAAGTASVLKKAGSGKTASVSKRPGLCFSDEVLVPVGGGKDSVVTLEILKKHHPGAVMPMVVNSRGATRTCCMQAGFEDEDCVLVNRTIDPHLLELNAQGYLNGHTPFSAMLAFVTLLASAFTGYRHIALSNENSANESTVRGENVNHQYSKSLEFENDFREYVRTYIGAEYDYFSFLRPLNEIGIARLFASIPLYHSLFRSCNAGSKTDSWCGKCPKCLFAFIILCPFLGIGKTSRIFGKNLLDDRDLHGFLDELCGKAAVKPFECVGTVDEVNWSLRQLRAYASENALLRYYFGIPEGEDPGGNDKLRPAVPAGDADALLEEFSSENNVPVNLLAELREAVAEVQLRQDAASETGHLIRNPLPDTVCEAFRPFFEKAGPVAVLGFGREGQSTYRFIRKLLPAKEIWVIDRNEAVRRHLLLAEDKAVRFLTGDAYLEDFAARMRAGAFGIVMKTPGISLKDYPDLLASPLLSSQADLFLRVYAPQVIGITGTKGKSTTTLLTYHLLQVNRPCLLAGNMGLPFFEILDEIGPNTWIVCEFSAHQLEQVKRAPRIGVLLNLYEEHLDHYRSYWDYQQAKMNIAGRGVAGGEAEAKAADRVWPEDEGKRFLIYNEDDGLVCERIEERFPEMLSGDSLVSFLPFSLRNRAALYLNRKNRVVACSKERKPKEVVFDLSQPNPLIGKHNVRNLMAALLAAHATGVPCEALVGRIASFKPLPHRLEYVGCVDGVYYFDDSISTIPEAAVIAVESLIELSYVKGVDTLILGGFDRGIDYRELQMYLCLKRVRNVAFTGMAGRRILSNLLRWLLWGVLDDEKRAMNAREGLEGTVQKPDGEVVLENCLYSDDYRKIVSWAKRVTRPGYACLLSPAAASYDHFKNFEERGEVFKRLVLNKEAGE